MNRTRGQFEVPVAPIAEAFARSGVTASELARRLGWVRPDTTRVRRQLGQLPDFNGRGYPITPRETMSYTRALEIAEALGIDPVDLNL